MFELIKIRGRDSARREEEPSILGRSVDLSNWFDSTTRTTTVGHTWVFQPLTFVSNAHSSVFLDFLKKHLSPRVELIPPPNLWKYERGDIVFMLSVNNVISPNAEINMTWENTPAGINLGIAANIGPRNLFVSHVKEPTLEEVIREAEQKVATSDIAGAYKLIFRRIDQAMRAGDFNGIDAAIANALIGDFALEVLIALLTATLPARSKLASRDKLLEAAQQVAKDRRRWTATLFSGL